MQRAVDDLIALLDLEADRGQHLPRASAPTRAASGCSAARSPARRWSPPTRTVDEPAGRVHSLHAYFLRPGDPTVPILYEVDRIRDGRSFTTRRVVAIQHGKAIFNLQASFHVHEDGPRPPGARCRRRRRRPRRCPTSAADGRRTPRRSATGTTGRAHRHPLRRLAAARPQAGRCRRYQQVWLRADGELPDDPVLHACIVTYASRHDPARHHAPPPRRWARTRRDVIDG